MSFERRNVLDNWQWNPKESKAKTITLSKMAVSATRVQNSNLEKINLKIPALFKPKTKEEN